MALHLFFGLSDAAPELFQFATQRFPVRPVDFSLQMLFSFEFFPDPALVAVSGG